MAFRYKSCRNLPKLTEILWQSNSKRRNLLITMISKLVCYCIFDIFVLTFEVQFSWDLLANLVDIEDFLASRISVHDINHNILRESFSICKCISSLCRCLFDINEGPAEVMYAQSCLSQNSSRGCWDMFYDIYISLDMQSFPSVPSIC